MKFKRLTAAFLSVIMLFVCMPVQAFAGAFGVLANNTQEENESILSRLAALEDSNAEEVLDTLEDLGLLDENGQLDLDQEVVLNGKGYVISEIESMLDNGADLTQVAYVDDVPIALGDLRTMIEIEKELQYLSETYLSEYTYTDEQLASLDAMTAYATENGLTMLGADAISPIDDHAVVDTCSEIYLTDGYVPDEMYALYQNARTAYAVTVVKDKPFSFDFRLLNTDYGDQACVVLAKKNSDGSYQCIRYANSATDAKSDEKSGSFSYTPTESGTLYLAVGSVWPINDAGETPHVFYGNVYGAVSFYNCNGISFRTDSTGTEETLFTALYAEDYFGTAPDGTSLDKYLHDPLYLTNQNWECTYSSVPYYYYVFLRTQAITDNSLEDGYLDWRYSKILKSWELMGDQALDSDTNKQYLLYQLDFKTEGNYWVGNFHLPLQSTFYPNISSSVSYWRSENIYESQTEVTNVYSSDDGGTKLSAVAIKTTRAIPYFCIESAGGLVRSYIPTKTTVTGLRVSLKSAVSKNKIEITVPGSVKSFRSGEYIPILMRANALMQLKDAKIEINGTDYDIVKDLYGQKNGSLILMWYRVQESDNKNLNIKLHVNTDGTIDGFKGFFANFSDIKLIEDHQTVWNFTDITMNTVLPERAAASPALNVSCTDGETPDLCQLTVTATIPDSAQWRTAWANGITASAVILNNETGETVATVDSMTMDGNISYVTGTVTVKKQLTEQNCTVRLILKKGEESYIRYAYQKTLQIPEIVLVTELNICDSSDVRALSLGDEYRPKLTVNFTGSPTFRTGSWSSSDADIATIDADGTVMLTGNKTGEVYFTFTADDGGTHTDNLKSAISETYTVTVGTYPSLVIPGNSGTVITRNGNPARVLWSTNANYFSDAPFTFRVELYEGNYTADTLPANPIYTVTPDNTATSVLIPAEQLTKISTGMTPAYTVRISMPHPQYPELVLTVLTHIVVRPSPVTVTLSSDVGGSYAVDSRGNVEIKWNVAEYSDGNTEGSVVITRVSEDSTTEEIYRNDAITESGSYTLTLKAVPAAYIKDTYMVQAQARNDEEDGWSTDAFPLYVYRDGFLSLVDENGNTLPDTVTLDNTPLVEGYTGALVNNGQSTEAILRLRETLGLYLYSGVNYDSDTWLLKNDCIQWKTSDDAQVHVNYAQGGTYENINRFDYTVYLPLTKMMLSSDTDGTATVTATHANTGISDSVCVNVNTLKNSFYLFQFTPAAETKVTYLDSKNQTHTVMTNSDGVLALYEPDGIEKVWLSSTVNGDVYLGTMYSVKSGEGDYASGQLYPLNTFKLRPAAKVTLNLKKTDGSSYTGKVTVRGGVYKNDGYCGSAQIGVSPDTLQDGDTGTVFTVDKDGFLTVYMDSTQFWSEENGETAADGFTLSAEDALTYIYELTAFDGNAYYPVFVETDGTVSEKSIVESAENIVDLEEKVQADDVPYLVRQTITYSGSAEKDVRHRNGYIGPSATMPEAELYSVYYIYEGDSQESNTYRVEMVDQYGTVPDCQSSEHIEFPFASYAVIANTMTLTSATMTDSGWLDKDADRRYAKLTSRVYVNGNLVTEMPTGLKAVDMTSVGDASDADEIAKLLSELSDVSSFLNGSLQDGISSLTDNNVVTVLVGLLKTDSIAGNLPVKLIISPTESNTRFKAMIVAGVNNTGLDGLDYNETGVAWDYTLLNGSDAAMPSAKKKRKMAIGAAKAAATSKATTTTGRISDAAQTVTKRNSQTSVDVTLEGTYEAEILYDFVEEKWKIITTGGGATAGIGISYGVNINGEAVNIPVSANFTLSGSMELSVFTAVRFNEVSEALKWTTGYDSVNDFLISLRLNAYFEAFGGVGFDYSVVAVKTGIFGRISVDAQMNWLLRDYLADPSERRKDGQYVKLSGEAGIRFVIKLLIFSYECVIGSGSVSYAWAFNDAQYIQNYWANTGSGYDDGSGLLTAVPSTMTLQSREYLEAYARSYEEPCMCMTAGGIDTIQDNANPSSEPQTTADGSILLYVSDKDSGSIYDSRVLAGETIGSAVEIGKLSDFEGYGDSSPSLSGEDGFAVAAWARMGASLTGKDAGDTISVDEQLLLMNSSEIVASVYNGSTWTPVRLTENETPDLAPAVAAANGRAIVAWRSVYSDYSGAITDFTDDKIVYRTYADGVWGKETVLYNGTAGSVKSLNAAMTEDGTALVTYTLTREDTTGAEKTVLAYTMVSADGTAGSTMFVTDGTGTDENVQLSVVTDRNGNETYILAWYSTASAESDSTRTVRFLSVDKNGMLSNSFPESASQLCSDTDVTIPGTFRLAQLTGGSALDKLMILWSQSADTDGNPVSSEDSEEVDHSILYAAKFCYAEDGTLYLSAPQVIAELEERTLLGDISAYVDDTETVYLTMLNTWYDDSNFIYYDSVTGERYTGTGVPSEGSWIYVPSEECKLQQTSGWLENEITVDSIEVDYENLTLNTLTPIRFYVRNAGIESIDKLWVTLDGKKTEYALTAPLMPNETIGVTCYYTVGDELVNPDYTVEAEFTAGTEALSGTVYLCYPDIGISKMEILSEQDGKRTVRMTLYNNSPADLLYGTHQIKLGLYSDSNYTTMESVDCSSGDVIIENGILSVSGEDALRLINEGVYTLDFVYDVKAYLDKNNLSEIPDEGLRLYADSWIVKDDNIQYELDEENNMENICFESLLIKNDETLTTELIQDNSGEYTVASVKLQNNSMCDCANSALIVNLLDNKGSILEQQQIVPEGTISGEGCLEKEIRFSQKGSRISLMSGTLPTGDPNATELTALNFEGWSISIGDFTRDNQDANLYTAIADVDSLHAIVSFVCPNDKCTVTIDGTEIDGWMGSVEVQASRYYTVLHTIVVTNGSNRTEYSLVINPIKKNISASSHGITVIPSAYGTVTADDSYAPINKKITLTVQAAVDWKLDSLTVKTDTGREIDLTVEKAGELYTFRMPGQAVIVQAVFTEAETEIKEDTPAINCFADIRESDYYYYAVLWATEKGITSGTDATHFSPDTVCTRAQMVTFLWRAAGSPEPTVKRCQFTDVKTDAYYYQAVLWATEKGITSGTDATTFSPDAVCTRAQAVTFLYRYSGSPAVSAKNIFTDVNSDAYYYNAVLWAIENGITVGTGKNKFSPDAECTRAQIVMFLYRDKEK